MSSNQRRGFFGRRPAVVRASAEQLSALTAAFFECESRMTEVGPSVEAAHAARVPGDPSADWQRLREQYDAVLGVYLRVSATDSHDATPEAVDGCLRSFRGLAADIDQFISRHARALTDGRAAVAGSAYADQQARTSAARAAEALAAAPMQFATLASVRSAADALADAVTVFETSTEFSARQAAAEQVSAAARDLEARVAAAPELASDADRTIRSLTTRSQALENRLSTVPEVISTLLREFSAGCSADLVHADTEARDAIDAGLALLDRAKRIAATSPDESLAVAEQARDRLAQAGDIVDRVFDRRQDLRQVRADPKAETARVRFRLRDAQHFAMQHGLAREWGSVLDAQSDRIDRAGGELERVHPDYWSYLSQLRTVDARITEIVDRMRHQIANP